MAAEPTLPSSDRPRAGLSRLFSNRLRLAALPQGPRRFTWLALVVTAASGLLILALSLGAPFRGLIIPLPPELSPFPGEQGLPVPFGLLLFFLLGMGFLAPVVVYGSYRPGWRYPRATRLLVGLLCLAPPLYQLNYSVRLASVLRPAVTGATAIGLYVQLAFTLLALVGGLLTLILAGSSRERVSRLTVPAAAAAFLALVPAFLIFRSLWEFLGQNNLLNDQTVALVYLPVSYVMYYAFPLLAVASIVFFWQAVAEAKLLQREFGVWVAGLAGRTPALLAALVALKLAWLAAGYAGWLPGGPDDLWERSRAEGRVAWGLAVLFAGVAGYWLVCGKRPLSDRGLPLAPLAVAGGFVLPFFLANLVAAVAKLVEILECIDFRRLQLLACQTGEGLPPLTRRLVGLGFWLADQALAWQIALMLLLIPAGLLIRRWPRGRYLSTAILLIGIWALPLAVSVLLDVAGRSPGLDVAFDYLTFDAALTAVLVVLAALHWRGGLQRPGPWALTLVLVVSSSLALLGTLTPLRWQGVIFAVGLIFPAAYQWLFDSRALNEPGPEQASAVLRTGGLTAVLMLWVAFSVGVGSLTPETATFEDVANRLFLPPILALLLGSAISSRAPGAEREEG